MRALLLMLFCAACGPSSRYLRTSASAGEVVWAFDNGRLVAQKDGRVVGKDQSWGDLPAALGCIPDAAREAEAADRQATAGKTIAVGGALVGLGMVAGGTYVAINSSNIGDAAIPLAVGLLLGGVVTGITLGVSGLLDSIGSRAHAFDAVNRYNDRFPRDPACTGGARARPGG